MYHWSTIDNDFNVSLAYGLNFGFERCFKNSYCVNVFMVWVTCAVFHVAGGGGGGEGVGRGINNISIWFHYIIDYVTDKLDNLALCAGVLISKVQNSWSLVCHVMGGSTHYHKLGLNVRSLPQKPQKCD